MQASVSDSDNRPEDGFFGLVYSIFSKELVILWWWLAEGAEICRLDSVSKNQKA